jgi:phage terminase small subunit
MKLIRLQAEKPVFRQPKPPKHLSLTARRLWTELCVNWKFNAAELAVLQSALEALDRLESARRLIDVEGLTVVHRDTGVVRKHPAIEVEKIARSAFYQGIRQLGLREDELPKRLGRPPGSNQL